MDGKRSFFELHKLSWHARVSILSLFILSLTLPMGVMLSLSGTSGGTDAASTNWRALPAARISRYPLPTKSLSPRPTLQTMPTYNPRPSSYPLMTPKVIPTKISTCGNNICEPGESPVSYCPTCTTKYCMHTELPCMEYPGSCAADCPSNDQ